MYILGLAVKLTMSRSSTWREFVYKIVYRVNNLMLFTNNSMTNFRWIRWDRSRERAIYITVCLTKRATWFTIGFGCPVWLKDFATVRMAKNVRGNGRKYLTIQPFRLTTDPFWRYRKIRDARKHRCISLWYISNNYIFSIVLHAGNTIGNVCA